MMKFLRSQSQTVLVLILLVIGGSFIFYGNVGSLLTGSGGRGNDFGRVDGQDLSVAELYDAVRTTKDSLIMSGHGEEINQAGGRAALAQEAWRRLLLLHEADRLHIEVTDQELIDFIHRQAEFQKDGVYSPDLYQKAMAGLETAHISPEAFEQVVRDNLRLEAVSSALLSPVRAPTEDIAGQYEKFNGPAQVSVVTIDPRSMAAAIKVTPAEVAAEYKAHPDNPALRTTEQRKVDYVLFPLTPDQAKLAAKDKAPALEALGEKALEFALALQPDPSGTDAHPAAPDFTVEAQKKGLAVQTTDFFSVDSRPAGVPPSPAFNNAAFALTKENPVSKVVELTDGVAVLHLDDIQPSQLKPLAAVQGDIVRQLQQTKAAQQAQFTAQLVAQVLRAQVAKGMDFKTAANAQKLPFQVMGAFIPAKVAQEDNRMQAIAYGSVQLAVGEISAPLPVEGDGSVVIVHLDKRDPADAAGLADFENRFSERQNEQVRNMVYVDWADWMSKQPGTHPPPDLEQYGSIE